MLKIVKTFYVAVSLLLASSLASHIYAMPCEEFKQKFAEKILEFGLSTSDIPQLIETYKSPSDEVYEVYKVVIYPILGNYTCATGNNRQYQFILFGLENKYAEYNEYIIEANRRKIKILAKAAIAVINKKAANSASNIIEAQEKETLKLYAKDKIKNEPIPMGKTSKVYKDKNYIIEMIIGNNSYSIKVSEYEEET